MSVCWRYKYWSSLWITNNCPYCYGKFVISGFWYRTVSPKGVSSKLLWGCPAAFIPGKIKGLQGGGSSAKMGRRVQPSNVRQPLHFHREIDPAYQTIDPPKVYKDRYLEFQTCFAFCCFRYQNNCTADCGGFSFPRGTDGWQSIAILFRCEQSQTIFYKDDLIFYED